ncbi:hypothetical protein [Macrococcus animalis]|uniref:hypothetical protein n=1 Tax=Macrococcus animalis TaxID=3395467 RepID=UPI0039BDDFAD
MYTKKITKRYYYKWLIILPLIYLIIEILDSIFLKQPLDYSGVIGSSIGAAIGMYISYSRDSVTMNDKGEMIIEDEFSRKLSLEFNRYFLIILAILGFAGFEILRWTKTKVVTIDHLAWTLFVLFFSYFIGHAIYNKVKSYPIYSQFAIDFSFKLY